MRVDAQREDGFSVVELVIGAAILFFALTALIGLMGATTSQTGSAKARSILTNTIATEMDYLRSIPYDQLALTTDSPPGILTPTKVVNIDGYTITFTYTILMDDPAARNTKRVTLTAVSSREGVPDIRTTATASIKPRSGAAVAAGNDPPEIQFLPVTPEDGAVVMANTQEDGAALTIGADAISSGEFITRIDFFVTSASGTAVLLKGSASPSADVARQNFSGENDNEQFVFQWDTRQVSSANAPEVADGARTVRIVAYDTLGRPSNFAERKFIVDNHPPLTAPSGMTLTRSDAVSGGSPVQVLVGNWGDVMDGTDPAPAYEAQLYENTNGAASPGSWTLAGSASAKLQPFSGVQPFGQYTIRSRALSPRGLTGPWSTGFSAPVLTRPLAAGVNDVTREWANNNNDRWTIVGRPALPRPRYPYNPDTLQVQLLRWVGTANPSTVDVTAAAREAWAAGQPYVHVDTWSNTIRNTDAPPQIRYQYRVTITPVGWQAVSTQVQSSFSTANTPSPATFTYPGKGSVTSTDRVMGQTW